MDDGLRQARCGRCGVIFYLCQRCERGQIYCGPACRREARRRSLRAARARHQASELGRLDHRDHQRAYRARLRLVTASVTDQGSPRPPASRKVAAPAVAAPIPGVADPGGRSANHERCDHGGDRRHLRRDAAAGDAPPARGDDGAAGGAIVRPSLDAGVATGKPGAGLAATAPRCAVCGVESAFIRLTTHRRSRPPSTLFYEVELLAPRAGAGKHEGWGGFDDLRRWCRGDRP